MSGDNPHGEAACRKPKAWRRRNRHRFWVCPDCGQAWVSRRSSDAPDNPLGYYSEGPFWGWWRWPLEAPGKWHGVDPLGRILAESPWNKPPVAAGVTATEEAGE